MGSVFQGLEPGFDVRVQQGANPTLNFTVYDRAGNPIDLTGYSLKFAAKRVDFRSNGFGKITRQETVIADVDVTLVDAELGNVSIDMSEFANQTVAVYPASLRIWFDATTTRMPDEAYEGTVSVARSVVRQEAV